MYIGIPAIVTGDSGRSWPVAQHARVALRKLYRGGCALGQTGPNR